jgi:hypothetical protein
METAVFTAVFVYTAVAFGLFLGTILPWVSA